MSTPTPTTQIVYTVTVTEQDGEVLLRQYPTRKDVARWVVRALATHYYGLNRGDHRRLLSYTQAVTYLEADEKVLTVTRGARGDQPPLASPAFSHFIKTGGAPGPTVTP